MKPIIVIEVKGGCVTSVKSNTDLYPYIEIVVRDIDNILNGDSDPMESLQNEDFQYTLW